MNKILSITALLVFKIDTVLYKTFGIVSTLRRQSWRRQGKRLQCDLDCEHYRRDRLNALHGTWYTTKQALALDKGNKL